MARRDNLVVMIPTLNEAPTIKETIDDVREFVPQARVLVIDSESPDGTATIASKTGADVIVAPVGGKGLAVRTVLPEILVSYPSRYYVMMDGDFTYPAKHIPALVEELKKGADVVIGYRRYPEKGALSRTNRVGNWGLSIIASILFGMRVRDLCSGMWGFRREALSKFVITSDRFTLEADLFINARRLGCGIAQVPIRYRARTGTNRSKLRPSDGVEIAKFLLRSRLCVKGTRIP